jgi:hypothetical protein
MHIEKRLFVMMMATLCASCAPSAHVVCVHVVRVGIAAAMAVDQSTYTVA